MKRPTGLTVIAVLMFLGAAVLVLGSVAFFFVAVMGMSGGDADAQESLSVAIAGMGVGGGFSLLVLAGVATFLAIGVLELREWARIASITFIVAGIGCVILSLSAFSRYAVLPVVPSLACHMLVTATAIWMLAYLFRPRIKQAFNAATT